MLFRSLNWKFIAMIILHFHLHPQFKYELFHIYFTSEISYLPRTNTVPAHLCGVTVKSYQNCKILSKLYAVFDEVGRNSVAEYKSGTNWCNKCSILADKEFASHPGRDESAVR